MTNDVVEVQFTTSGQPLRVRRNGRIWHVGVEPTRHFERVKWWEIPGFKVKRSAADRIDYVIWRVQVRLGRNIRSDLVTWDLVEHPRDDSWSVREVV